MNKTGLLWWNGIASLACATLMLGCDREIVDGPAGATSVNKTSGKDFDVVVLPNNTTVHCTGQELTALRPDGEILWKLTVPDGDKIAAPAAAAASSVVFVRGAHAVYAASPEGKWLWSKPTKAPAARAAGPVAMSDSTAVLLDGTEVIRLDAQGGVRWQLPLPEGEPNGHLSATIDGAVIVPTTAGVYAVTADGTIAWRRKLGG
jgi:outer membrane protein assembly factor BamB